MQLTKTRQQQIKKSIQKYPKQKTQYIYTIAQKQSASKLFSNTRLLWIDIKQKTISYSDIGKNQPFINQNKPIAKGTISIASPYFKYLRIKQKQPTIRIWEQVNPQEPKKVLNDWKFQFQTAQALTDMIHIVNFLYANSSKSQISLVQSSQLDKYNIGPMQRQTSPINNQNPKLNQKFQSDKKPSPNNLSLPSLQANKQQNNSQNLTSVVQSPIHKLDDILIENQKKQKLKYSEAYSEHFDDKNKGTNSQIIYKQHGFPKSPQQQPNKFGNLQQINEKRPTSKNNQNKNPYPQNKILDDQILNQPPQTSTKKQQMIIPKLNMQKLSTQKNKVDKNSIASFNDRNKNQLKQEQYDEQDDDDDDDYENDQINPHFRQNQGQISSIAYYQDPNAEPTQHDGIIGGTKSHKNVKNQLPQKPEKSEKNSRNVKQPLNKQHDYKTDIHKHPTNQVVAPNKKYHSQHQKNPNPNQKLTQNQNPQSNYLFDSLMPKSTKQKHDQNFQPTQHNNKDNDYKQQYSQNIDFQRQYDTIGHDNNNNIQNRYRKNSRSDVYDKKDRNKQQQQYRKSRNINNINNINNRNSRQQPQQKQQIQQIYQPYNRRKDKQIPQFNKKPYKKQQFQQQQQFKYPYRYKNNNNRQLQPQQQQKQKRQQILFKNSKHSKQSLQSIKNIHNKIYQSKVSKAQNKPISHNLRLSKQQQYKIKKQNYPFDKPLKLPPMRNWNLMFNQSNNSLQIYQKFIQTCYQIIENIIFSIQYKDIFISESIGNGNGNNQSVYRIQQDGIIFNIYRYQWIPQNQIVQSNTDKNTKNNKKYNNYIHDYTNNLQNTNTQNKDKDKGPQINFKLSSLDNIQMQISDLIYLYCRIHDELQQFKNVWESNRYIMQKLLNTKLDIQQSQQQAGNINTNTNTNINNKISKNNNSFLIQSICPTLTCYIQFLGYSIYCQANTHETTYQYIQNWQNKPIIRSLLNQLENIIHLQLSNNTFQIYQHKSKGKQQQYVIKIVKPIFPILSAADSLITSYVNGLNVDKYIHNVYNAQNTANINPHPSTSTSSPPIIITPLSTKSLQSQIHTQLQTTLSHTINTGSIQSHPSYIFSLCGSQQYNQLMQYYNINKTNIQNLYILINIHYYRQIIVSQLCADVFVKMLVYSLHQQVEVLYRQVRNTIQKGLEFRDKIGVENMGNRGNRDNREKQLQQQQQQQQQQQSNNPFHPQSPIYQFLRPKRPIPNSPKLQYFSSNSLNLNLNSANFSQASISILSDISQLYRQIIYLWLNNLLSYNNPSSDILWLQISQIVKAIFNIDCSNRNQSTLPGYMMDFVMRKLGVQLGYVNKNWKNLGTSNIKDKQKQRQKSRDKDDYMDKDIIRSRRKSGTILNTSQRNIYQFPSILNYAYIQSNVLSFLKIQPTPNPNTNTNANVQKSITYSKQTYQQFQPIIINIQIQQYRCSAFSVMNRILERNVLGQLIRYRVCGKQNMCVVGGSVGYMDDSFGYGYGQGHGQRSGQYGNGSRCIGIGQAGFTSFNNNPNNKPSSTLLPSTSSHLHLTDPYQILTQITTTNNQSIPSYLFYIQKYIKLYLSSITKISYKNNKKYQNLKIYNPKQLPILTDNAIVSLVPHNGVKLMMYCQIIKQILGMNGGGDGNNMQNSNSINGSIYNKHTSNPISPHTSTSTSASSNALYLFNCILQQNVFWGSQYNPYLIQIYNIFVKYWLINKQYIQAIKVYKSSMVILLKIYPDSLMLADRHCYLAELLCMAGKYQEAVKELQAGIGRYGYYGRIQGEKFGGKQWVRVGEDGANQNIVYTLKDEDRKQVKNYQILILKYIRSTIKRSKILLRTLRNSLNQSPKSYSKNSTFTSQQIAQIIDPLLSILNQIKQPAPIPKYSHNKFQSLSSYNSTSYKYSSHGQQPQHSPSPSHLPSSSPSKYSYKHTKPCPPFTRYNIIKPQQLSTQLLQIIQLMYRSYVLMNRIPQLVVFIGQYIMNTRILQALSITQINLQKILKIYLGYQLKINGSTRKQEQNQLLLLLAQMLGNNIQVYRQNGYQITQNQAYSYIYYKYINNNIKIQTYNNTQIQIQNQYKNSNTNKKTQRSLVSLLPKRLTQSIRKIQKIMNDIKINRLLQYHKPLNMNTKSQSQEILVLMQAIGVLVGFEYMLGLIQDNNQQGQGNYTVSGRDKGRLAGGGGSGSGVMISRSDQDGEEDYSSYSRRR